MSRILQDVNISAQYLHTAGASLFMVGFLVALPAVSHAVPINHGTYPGDTVVYVDVTEDTNTGDVQPLFGVPTVTGDSMDFEPCGFSASSSGGGEDDITDGQLAFDIVAKTDKFIKNISFSEAGDTALARGFDPADDASTSVVSFIFLDILELSSGPIAPINAGPFEMVFTHSDGDFILSDDGGGSLTFNSGWTGSAFIDFGPILADHGISGQVIHVSVFLDNRLTAISSAGSSAFIGKKEFHGVTTTVNVPEPMPGDFDDDDDTDGADFLYWQLNDGSESNLDLWQATFGNVASPMNVASTTVPEPTAGLLLMLGIAVLLFRRDGF